MAPQMALDFTGRWSPALQATVAAGMQQADDHAAPEWRHLFDAGLVAVANRSNYIGIELNPAYVEIGRSRLRRDAPLFAQAAD